MLTGWFTLHRDWLASEYWIETPYDRAHALMDLVGHARFKPGHTRLRGRRIDLERGQLAWSQKQLGIRWGWSVGKVRRFLDELTRDGIARTEGNAATTVITILNYDEAFDMASNTPRPTSQAERPNETTPKRPKQTEPNELTSEPTLRRQPTKEPCQPSQHRQPPKRRMVAMPLVSTTDAEDTDAKTDAETEAKQLAPLTAKLRQLGVTGADQVLDSAAGRGLSLDEATQLVAEFAEGVLADGPPAWGPGALVARLVGKLASWPTPSEAHRRHLQRQADRRRDAAKRSADSEQTNRIEAERAEQAALEQQLGPLLDGMTEVDHEQLEARTVPDEAERRLSRRCGSLHRLRLLETLKEELRHPTPRDSPRNKLGGLRR